MKIMKNALIISLILAMASCSSVKTEGNHVGKLDLKKKTPSVVVGVSTIKKQEPTKNPTPATPTPATPTPANPTPANPTPANPTPANPTPANPTPTNPTPTNPPSLAVIHFGIGEKRGAQILNEMNDRPKKANTNPVSSKTTTPATQKMTSASEQKTTKVGIFDIKLSRLLWFYLCCAVVLGVLFYVYRFFCHFLAIRKLKNPFKTSQETADKTKPDSSDDGSYGGAGV